MADRDLDEVLASDMAACRELAAGALADEPVEPLGAISAGVRDEIAAERGLAARLRSMPTRLRVALVWGLVATLVLGGALLFPRREDLAIYPVWRMVLTIGVFSMLAGAASWRILRPLHLPPARPWLGASLLAVGVMVPCIFALVPLPHEGVAAGTGAVFVLECGRCAAFGALMGLPVMVLALLAGRSRVEGVVASLAGVAAGLTGNTVLQLHCPNTNIAHQLVGHWGVLLVLPLATAIWCARR